MTTVIMITPAFRVKPPVLVRVKEQIRAYVGDRMIAKEHEEETKNFPVVVLNDTLTKDDKKYIEGILSEDDAIIAFIECEDSPNGPTFVPKEDED